MCLCFHACAFVWPCCCSTCQIGTAPRDQYTKSYISKEMVSLNLNSTATVHAEFLSGECVTASCYGLLVLTQLYT